MMFMIQKESGNLPKQKIQCLLSVYKIMVQLANNLQVTGA